LRNFQVAHLLVLSGDISSNHQQSSRLLQDIHATYQWLNTHAVEARPALRRHENDPIFLNLPLDDLDLTQTWVWKSARQLVFNISYDTNDLAAVRDFLTPFRPLLLAAGVKMLSDPTYETKAGGQKNDFSALRTAFNSMREAGELTDVTLMPTEGLREGEIEKLKAHKCFLAAAVPHLRDVFLSGMAESMSGEYSFVGSEFGARAVLGKYCNLSNGRCFWLTDCCRLSLHRSPMLRAWDGQYTQNEKPAIAANQRYNDADEDDSERSKRHESVISPNNPRAK
jgi:hypothetical protein